MHKHLSQSKSKSKSEIRVDSRNKCRYKKKLKWSCSFWRESNLLYSSRCQSIDICWCFDFDIRTRTPIRIRDEMHFILSLSLSHSPLSQMKTSHWIKRKSWIWIDIPITLNGCPLVATTTIHPSIHLPNPNFVQNS